MKTTNKVLSEEELEKAISSKRILTVEHYNELHNHADKLAKALKRITLMLPYQEAVAVAKAALAKWKKWK